MNYSNVYNYYVDMANDFLKQVKTDCNVKLRASKPVEADKNDKPIDSSKTFEPIHIKTTIYHNISIPAIRNIGPNPKKNTVTVVFADGTKVVTKCNEADVFDINVGVALALAEKMFGSKNKYHKMIKEKSPKAKTSSDEMDELRAKQKDLENQLNSVNKAIRKLRTGK